MDRELWFVVPGDLDTRTGGYGYDRAMIEQLRLRGMSVHVVSLAGEYPAPSGADRAAASRALACIPDSSVVVIDGLAFGALPDEAAGVRARLRLVALVHHPLALETGIAPAEAERLRASEEQALRSAAGVVVTSHRTVGAVKDLGVSPEQIAVVEPGIHSARLAVGSSSGPVRLLCVASVVPRKGHDTLFAALSHLADLDWRLSCVGSVERDSLWGREMQRRSAAAPLSDRVEFAGELEGPSLDEAYHRADLFVLSTRYEGYGMVVAEALARGLPVVSTPTGAIAELVTPDVGELVPADDPPALASALRGLIRDRKAIDRLRAGALSRRAALRSWDTAGDDMVEAIARLAWGREERSDHSRATGVQGRQR
jgi:glycosyltransferase involved in cell wall biosynthesis